MKYVSHYLILLLTFLGFLHPLSANAEKINRSLVGRWVLTDYYPDSCKKDYISISESGSYVLDNGKLLPFGVFTTITNHDHLSFVEAFIAGGGSYTLIYSNDSHPMTNGLSERGIGLSDEDAGATVKVFRMKKCDDHNFPPEKIYTYVDLLGTTDKDLTVFYNASLASNRNEKASICFALPKSAIEYGIGFFNAILNDEKYKSRYKPLSEFISITSSEYEGIVASVATPEEVRGCYLYVAPPDGAKTIVDDASKHGAKLNPLSVIRFSDWAEIRSAMQKEEAKKSAKYSCETVEKLAKMGGLVDEDTRRQFFAVNDYYEHYRICMESRSSQ